jgi:hypothetical protein
MYLFFRDTYEGTWKDDKKEGKGKFTKAARPVTS